MIPLLLADAAAAEAAGGAISAIATVLDAAGAIGLASVLIWILTKVWSRLEKRDQQLQDTTDKFAEIVEKSAEQAGETAEVLRGVANSIDRVESKVDGCPKR